MPPKLFLKNLTVPSPCSVDWNSMKGNDLVRFCEHCSLSVHNLSQMTRHQAERLVARSNGRLCVQFVPDANGNPLLAQAGLKLHRISRRVSRLAAGAFTATLSVSTAVVHASQNSQTLQSDSTDVASISQTIARAGMAGTLVGTLTDQMGAVITGATIALSSEQLHLALYASSDSSGHFRIDNLEPGLYNLRIEAPGFAAEEVGTIYLQAQGQTRVDRTLKVAGIESNVEVVLAESRYSQLGGVVMFTEPEHPFVKAAMNDELETLATLVSETDVNMRDKQSGTTALEHAVRNANREMVQFLLLAGADPNLRDATARTVLMRLDEDATSELVWDLINSGAKVNLQDESGNTALMEAATSKNVDVIKVLLDAGAKLDAQNKQGRTALMFAAEAGYVNTVRALLLAGADMTKVDKENKDALAHAVEENNLTVIRLLKARGAIETSAQKEYAGDDQP